MQVEPKNFCVIAEWKNEGPTVCECKPMSLDDAMEMARKFQNYSNVIRVAVVSFFHEWGNEALAPKKEEAR
jgi:hypothetical protein